MRPRVTVDVKVNLHLQLQTDDASYEGPIDLLQSERETLEQVGVAVRDRVMAVLQAAVTGDATLKPS
jgi:hypothetical protein